MKNIKTVFKGKYINVATASTILPNGYEANFEIINHPGASLIIPFLTKDKIIMIRQFRPVIKKYIYELPAGTLDSPESALNCAKREIVEETGYSAKKFTFIGDIYPVPGYSTERIFIYKAEDLKKETHKAEPDEVISTRVMTKRAIRNMFKTRKLIDAKTIAALAFCGWL